uniref:(northern house mosquito) hypothetical protein n=1 Tax=Culex pipiens TaxID=7175 RepID=A0A8D8BX45_CULPI
MRNRFPNRKSESTSLAPIKPEVCTVKGSIYNWKGVVKLYAKFLNQICDYVRTNSCLRLFTNLESVFLCGFLSRIVTYFSYINGMFEIRKKERRGGHMIYRAIMLEVFYGVRYGCHSA